MEKSVQVINISAVRSNNSLKTDSSGAEAGAGERFSQLLAPAQAEVAAGAPRQPVAATGKPLPTAEAAVQQGVSPEEQAALLALLDDAEVPPAAASAAVVPTVPSTDIVQQVAAQLPAVAVVPGGAAAQVVANTDNGTSVAADKAQPSAVAVAVQQTLVAVQGKPATPVLTASEDGAPAVALTPSGSQATAATSAETGPAIRAAVQEILAARTGGRDGGGQQTLAGHTSNVNIAATAATATVNDAAVASFSTILGETTGLSTAGRIAVPVGESGWGRALGEQVAWHVSRNIQSANLRLNPQHLGPLEMQVQMDGDRATVAFASQHVAVRDALESALPRLREMFSQNGLNIVDVNVSQQDTAARGEQQDGQAGTAAVAGDEDDVTGQDTLLTAARHASQAVGLFDEYA